MHKKYSYRNGKRYGPYYYENKRVNGKVVTTYLGADNLLECRRNNLYWIFAVVGLLFIFSMLFIFSEQMNLGILFSPAEPFSISFSQSRFEPGQAVVGELNLQLSEGELIPSEAEVVASLSNVEKSFTLSELLGEEYSISEGNFYLESSELSGSGSGYGLVGSKETFPDVSFQLKITRPIGTDTEIGGSDVPKEVSVESPSGTPVEVPAENPIETPVETPFEIPEENPAASEGTVSGTDGEDSGESDASENSGSDGSEPGSDSDTGSESSDSGEGSSGGESSGSSDSSGDSGGEPSFSPELVTANVRVIDGTTSKNSPFNYGLESGWSAELVSGSVKIGDETVDDGIVNVEENENGLVVSTDYSVLEDGFGQDFLGEETFEMNFGLDKFEFVAPQEDTSLDVRVEYMGQTLFETSENVLSGLVEENLTEENETTEIPIVAGNETFGNETVGNETNLTQPQIVLGQSVVWTKRVNAVGPTTLTIDLPKSAVVLSVEEIASDVPLEEEPPVVEEPQNLPPEIVSKETVAEGTGLEKIEPVVEQTAGELMLSPPEIETQKISVSIEANQVGVDITYETPAAEITSREIAENKLIITVSAPDLGLEHEYKDVLIFDSIPSEFIDKAGSARVYWREGAQYLPVQKVEGGSIFFVAPHLSNQTFEIIFITKAEHLDENRTFVGDVYDLVKTRDGSWAEIPEGNYLRVSFEKDLTSEKDITTYARANESSRIEVYEKDGIEKIAEFENVLEDKEYKIFLIGLSGEQDTFDLRVVGGDVEFDYVVDPAGICGSGHTNNGDGTCTAKLISNQYLDGVCSISGSCSSNDLTGNIGRNPSSFIFRQFYSFDTGDVPLDARIEEAKLSIKTGNSHSFAGSNADLVYFCDYGNSLEFGDFNAYISGLEALEILEGEIFNSAVNTYGDGVFYNLSVGSSRVNQTGKTQYCLKINNEGGSVWYHEFYFADAASESKPYLDVKYTPGVFTNWCYQENANQAYPPYDGSCGLDYSGSYTCSGQWADQFSCGRTYDSDWMNGGTVYPAGATVEITYKKPAGAEMSSLWKVAYYESDSPAKPRTEYVTIPSSCWNYDSNNLKFRVANYDTGLTFSCYNGGYLSVLETGAVGEGSSFREEAMWWNITRTNQLSVNFVSPTTPSGPQLGNSIYVNLSTQSMNRHYSFVDFDRDVKLWMRMDDVNSSGDPTDISSYSRNGTKVNQAAQSSVGYFNKNFVFDGTEDYIVLPAGALDSLNNEVTISAWLNDTDNLGVNFFLSFWKNPTENYVLGISHDTEPTPNYFRYENEIDGSGDVNNDISSCRSIRGVWEYWTVVLNSTTQRIYKNGTLCDSRPMIANFSRMDDGFATIIGAYGTGSNGWQGHIDELLIFGRSLSSDEVLSLFNSASYKYGNNFTSLASGAHTFTGYAADELGNRNQTEQRQVFLGADTYPIVSFVPSTPLNDSNLSTSLVYVNVSSIDSNDHYAFVDFDDSNVLWMRMDDVNSSGDPLDLSKYGNNFSRQGNAAQTLGGYFGKGFRFDGDGDQIVSKPGSKYPYFDDYGTYTWSMWVNLSQLNRDQWLISETSFGPPGGYVILVEDNNQVSFAAISGSGDNSVNYVNTTTTLNSGQFYHIVVTFNRESSIKIYIDGVQRASGYGYFDDSFLGNWFYFSSGSYSTGLNGTLDDVAIFNRVLSVDEIKSLYNASAYQYKNNFTNLSSGNHHFIAHAANKAGNKSQTEERLVHLIYSLSPSVRLNLPRNATVISFGEWIVLNATVDDTDGGQIATRTYVVREQDKNNMNPSVVFNKNVPAGSDMISNLTAVPVSISSPGLLSYWNLEDYNGYDVKDVFGGNTLVRGGDQSPADEGRFGKAFYFDGAGCYFANYSFRGFNRTEGAVSFWIKPNQFYLNSGYRTTNLLQSNSELSMTITHYNPGTDVLSVSYPTPSSPGTISRSLYLSASNWTHIAYTYRVPYHYRVYINGALVGGEYSPGWEYPPYSSLTSIYFGGDAGLPSIQNDLCGNMDDIAMWKRELNSSEVADLYSLSRGKYYWKVNVTDSQKYSNVSDVWEFNISDISVGGIPYVLLRAPPNESIFKEGVFNITLNASVYDDLNNIDVKIYAVNSTDTNNFYNSLLYKRDDVANGTNVIYNFTTLPVNPGSQNLVLLFHFDNDSSKGETGNIIYDWSGRGNNGTGFGGWGYNLSGKFGYGLQMDGINRTYVHVDGTPDINLAILPSKTVSAWFRVNDKNLPRKQVVYEEGGPYRGVNIYVYNGLLYMGSYNNQESAWNGSWLTTNKIESNKWHHAVIVLDGGNESIEQDKVRCYLDGAEFGRLPGSQLWPHSGDITIGAVGTLGHFHDGLINETLDLFSFNFNGTIDEVAIWTRNLSADEVEQMYTLRTGQYLWKVNVTDSDGNQNESETRVLNVTGRIRINQCGVLDQPGQIYQLTKDIGLAPEQPISISCFNITAADVVLDGHGFTINGTSSASSTGVTIFNSANNAIVKNLNMKNFYRGIWGVTSDNYLIEYNTIESSGFAGLQLGSTSQNSLVRYNVFRLNTNGIRALANANNNSFEYNIFEGGTDGIYLGPVSNNTILNNRFVGVGTSIRDEDVASMNYLLYKNAFGEIRWNDDSSNGFLRNTTVKGDLVFGDSIRIEFDYASLNFSKIQGGKVNSSANITLYGIGQRGYGSPVIVRDRQYLCDATTSPSCYNFTSLEEQTIVFNVSSWSNYRIMDKASLLSSCGNLVGNKDYVLVQDILNVQGNCFNITGDNVTLDGGGFKIQGDNSKDNFTVYAVNVRSIIISNLRTENFEVGIYFENVTNSSIENTVGTMHSKNAIYLGNSNFNTLKNNRAFNFSNPGIRLRGSNNNTIEGNLINTTSTGMRIWDSWNNVLSNNILSNNSGSGVWITNGSGSQVLGNAINWSIENGLLVENSSYVLIQNNSFFGNGKNGIYLSGSSNNFLKDTILYSNTQNGIWIFYCFNNSISNINSNSNGMHGLNLDSSSNNTFSNITSSNNLGNCGVYSINSFNNRFSMIVTNSNSHGLFFFSSYNNVVTNITSDFNGIYALAFTSRSDNNTIFDTSVSAPGYNGIYLSASANNTFVGGKVNGTKREAIILSDFPVAGNIFSNFSIMNTNSSYYDFRIALGGVNGTQLIDTAIANYSLNGTGGTVLFRNSKFGEIRFLQPINGSGTNLSNDVRIGNNSAVVLSNVNVGLNKSANITLYGIGNRGFMSPRILRDGTPCPAGICYNFTSLTAENVSFNVTSWTNYGIGEASLVATCRKLDEPNLYYKLTNDINGIVGTCFNITANNVTLDGQGFTINASTGNSGSGVEAVHRMNLTIKNLTIKNFDFSEQMGIYFRNTSNSLIINNILTSNAWGVVLYSGKNNKFEGNQIENSVRGVMLRENSSNNLFVGGKITNSAQDAVTLYNAVSLGKADNNTFRNVSILNTNSNYYDFRVETEVSGTFLADMKIANYSFTNNTVIFENSLFGRIQFLMPINGTGNNLSNDIRIGNNSVVVLSNIKSGLNKSANITLYGIGNGGMTNLQILRDGFPCPADVCYNFTSLNAENVSFNVTGWTNYSIGDEIPITTCGDLSHGYYKLMNDISGIGGTCFNIVGDYVTLDGRGFMINGSANNDGYGVSSLGRTNLIVRNLTIQNFKNSGIALSGSDSILAENILLSNAKNIGLGGITVTGNRNMVVNNTVKSSRYGLYVHGGGNNTFVGNYLENSSSRSIFVELARNNSFIGGKVVNSGQTATAIYVEGTDSGPNAAHDTTFKNVAVTNTSEGYSDIQIRRGANGTSLIDMNLGMYSFNTNLITFEDSLYGKVQFLRSITAAGTNLSNDLHIGNNSVTVESSSQPGLNVQANITLYKIGNRGFSKPTILRDDLPCSMEVCYNFTSLTAENVSFNVTGWTNYRIGDDNFISISSCPYSLSEPNKTYILVGNLSFSAPTRTCLFINASNIVVDGRGYFVRGNSIRYGISNTLAGVFCGAGGDEECYKVFDNVTVKNLTVVDFNRNIYFQNMTNSIVKDVISRKDVYNNLYDSLFFRAGVNNSVVNSKLYDDGSWRALQLDVTSNTNIMNTSVISLGGDGLVFTTTNKTSIIDSYVEAYDFQTSQNDLVFENTRYGKINFLTSITSQLGTNLSNDIKILNNSVFVDSATRVNLNKSANITLYGVGNIGIERFVIPGILRDGRFTCNAQTVPSCSNFTPLNIQDVMFNVSSWTNYSIGESQRAPIVTLDSPTNQANTTNRTLAFNWSVFDPNGDAITNVQINVSCYHFSGSPCSSDGGLIEFGKYTNNYTWQTELWHFYDDQYYYNWTVRASDASGWGSWASERRFNLQSLVEIVLLNSSVDFGELKPGNSSSTVNNNPRPLLLQNVGNVLVNVTLNASDLWISPGYGNPNHTYMFKIDNETGALQTAFNPAASIVTWTPVPNQTRLLLSIVQFKYNGTYTKAEVDLNITVPPAEPVGPRKSTLTFIAGRTS